MERYAYYYISPYKSLLASLTLGTQDGSDLSDDSQPEVNMSIYEERIRMARPLPPRPLESQEEEESVRLKQRPRVFSLPAMSSNLASLTAGTPKQSNPYLTESDFGIKLEVEDDVDQTSLLMTNPLISIVSLPISNEI